MKGTHGKKIDWLVSVLGAILLLTYTGRTRFPFINPDEANSIKYAHMGLFEMIRELKFDAHLPGYPFLLKLVDLFVGISRNTLYLVNALLLLILLHKVSSISSPLIRKFVMVLFVVLNPFVLETFGEIRPYVLLFSCLMMLLLQERSEDGSISLWTLPLALSHHLGFAAASMFIGATTLRHWRNRQTLPWAWITVILAILPLVLFQTVQIASEGRYIAASSGLNSYAGYGLGHRFVQLSRFFVGGGVFENPRYSNVWLICLFTFAAAVVSLALGHGKALWNRISVASLPILAVFIIHPSVLNFQYFTGALAVLIYLIIAPSPRNSRPVQGRFPQWSSVVELLIPLGLIWVSFPASLAMLQGKESFYKVNYAEALVKAEHHDYSEILLANGGVRGAALTAFDLIIPRQAQAKKVHDMYSEFYTGEGLTPAHIRSRLGEWASRNPGKRALLIYSSAPLPDLLNSPGIHVVAGPWQTSPGDYVSVIIEPAS